MPPGGHSRSHHSSSHHSSRSSSHHSSSRSRSSSSSRSSHSSSHHSTSSSSGSSYRRSTPVRRTRTSQPYGWNKASYGTVSHYHCATHDYEYYPQGWTASDGRYFEEGYYDENGRHYNNMLMVGGTTMLKCAYCGNRMVYRWKEGDLPVCDGCGAQFQIDITDKEEASRSIGGSGSSNGLLKGFSKIPLGAKIALAVMLISIALPVFLMAFGMIIAITGRLNTSETKYETASVQNSIYVEEIGRTCYLDGEDWYDSRTECWFYYNDTVSPYQWQYWYEGISSDYGDYGWMEYDMDEDAWYIETEEGNWVHLPESYDTSNLWHMTDEYVNAYE